MAGDLHCHTKLSDGSLGIDDLIVLAKNCGITTIAITDQDCLAGTVRGRIIGERHGIQVIPGVEISCTDPASGDEVHILGYLSESPDRLEGLCHRNLLARKKASQYMLVKLVQRYPISPELVAKCATGSTCVYPQHMLHALMESGLTDRIYGEIYDELFREESERNILFRSRFPSPTEVIEAVHQSGGVAVLAHPGAHASLDLDALIRAGLDGIEIYHSANSRELQKQLLATAKKSNILVTGGSDFRGMYGNGRVGVGQEQVNDSQINALLTYKSRMRRRSARAAEATEAEDLVGDLALNNA
ncbi:MAG: PHP domain-containing protein [Oscillospiraceae bacterium]|nr:PHP domain-containing protein [Oscillospiraceae bacterium]